MLVHEFQNLAHLPEIQYERFHDHYKPTRWFDHRKEHPSPCRDSQIPYQCHMLGNLLNSHNSHLHRGR